MERFPNIIEPCSRPVKRYCQALDLIDDAEMIQQYRLLHSPEKHWKEIRDGIREVGILRMDIYISGNHLFMIVDVEEDFDWEESFNKLSTLPRQAEWEGVVAKFQKCLPDAKSDEKWVPIERIFTLYPFYL